MKKSLLILLFAVCGVMRANAEVDKEQARAVYRAADQGDVAQVRALAGNPLDQRLMTFLLYQSIKGDDFKAFTTLLDAGADPAYSARGASDPAIHHAASTVARTPRYLQELLRRGVDVNTRNTLGETPLHSAMGLTNEPFRQIEKVEMLLDAGADIHARDKYGKTVLFKATMGHNPQRDWVMYFLEKGVDPRVKNDLGYTFQHGYLYGGNSTSDLLGSDARRRREAARKWLTERGIPLETRTMPMTPVERLGDSFISVLPDMTDAIRLDTKALQTFRLNEADAAAAMQAAHRLPVLNPAPERIRQTADALAAAFPQELHDVASLFYYNQYIAYRNDPGNVHTLAGALALYTAGNLAAARGAYPGDDAFNRDYYAAALQLDRYLSAHPPPLSGDALESAYLRLIMLGLHNAIAAAIVAPDDAAVLKRSGERRVREMYGAAPAQLEMDAYGIKLK